MYVYALPGCHYLLSCPLTHTHARTPSKPITYQMGAQSNPHPFPTSLSDHHKARDVVQDPSCIGTHAYLNLDTLAWVPYWHIKDGSL